MSLKARPYMGDCRTAVYAVLVLVLSATLGIRSSDAETPDQVVVLTQAGLRYRVSALSQLTMTYVEETFGVGKVPFKALTVESYTATAAGTRADTQTVYREGIADHTTELDKPITTIWDGEVQTTYVWGDKEATQRREREGCAAETWLQQRLAQGDAMAWQARLIDQKPSYIGQETIGLWKTAKLVVSVPGLGVDTYNVAPDLGYMVVRWEFKPAPTSQTNLGPRTIVVVDQVREVHQGLWLPSVAREIYHFDASGARVLVNRFVLLEADTQFDVPRHALTHFLPVGLGVDTGAEMVVPFGPKLTRYIERIRGPVHPRIASDMPMVE